MGKFKPTIENTTGRVARKIAEIIEDRGWIKDAFETPEGVCIMGGLNRVLCPMAAHQVPPILNHFTTTFARWMQENHPNPPNTPHQPPFWNDSVFTSKEETLAWLHKFADALDPQR